MVIGGAVLGVVPAILAYFITFHAFRKIRERRKRAKAAKSSGDDNPSIEDAPLSGEDTEDAHKP